MKRTNRETTMLEMFFMIPNKIVPIGVLMVGLKSCETELYIGPNIKVMATN